MTICLLSTIIRLYIIQYSHFPFPIKKSSNLYQIILYVVLEGLSKSFPDVFVLFCCWAVVETKLINILRFSDIPK